jgi:hypothetical protein
MKIIISSLKNKKPRKSIINHCNMIQLNLKKLKIITLFMNLMIKIIKIKILRYLIKIIMINPIKITISMIIVVI